MRLTFPLLLALSACVPIPPDLSGEAAVVIDGDTLDLVTRESDGPHRQRVRLWGIDAPERGDDGYAEASAWLALLLTEGEGVSCLRAEERDQRAGARVVATCWAGAIGRLEESLNCQLIRAGAAIEMERFSRGALKRCRG